MAHSQESVKVFRNFLVHFFNDCLPWCDMVPCILGYAVKGWRCIRNTGTVAQNCRLRYYQHGRGKQTAADGWEPTVRKNAPSRMPRCCYSAHHAGVSSMVMVGYGRRWEFLPIFAAKLSEQNHFRFAPNKIHCLHAPNFWALFGKTILHKNCYTVK